MAKWLRSGGGGYVCVKGWVGRLTPSVRHVVGGAYSLLPSPWPSTNLPFLGLSHTQTWAHGKDTSKDTSEHQQWQQSRRLHD